MPHAVGARSDGTALEFGTLRFDPKRGEYQIQPVGEAIPDEWYPTMGLAMDALYEAHVAGLCRRQGQLSEQLRRVREDLALLGGLR